MESPDTENLQLTATPLEIDLVSFFDAFLPKFTHMSIYKCFSKLQLNTKRYDAYKIACFYMLDCSKDHGVSF